MKLVIALSFSIIFCLEVTAQLQDANQLTQTNSNLFSLKDSSEVNKLIYKAELAWKQKNHSEALNKLNDALNISKIINHRKGIIKTLEAFGNAYMYNFSYDSAMQCFTQAIKLIEKDEVVDSLKLCQLYVSMGYSLRSIGQYKHSNNYLTKSMEISEKLNYNHEFVSGIFAFIKNNDDVKIKQQILLRNCILICLFVIIIISILLVFQRRRILMEKKNSEELLLNILPVEVAEELKMKGSAEAKQFDEVTVMFTDFKGFTQISEKLTPSELVAEIHTCFKEFDRIITKYNIEKIKTIGDSYMCAGGLPVTNNSNAVDVVNAALEIHHFIRKHLQERIENGLEPFDIRVGIHTGPVVAGIVGIKKYAYDIWGDTVNIASRMESSGEVGKVNISGSTYELVKEIFNCSYRGKIPAKNKGEIDMYFVESVIMT